MMNQQAKILGMNNSHFMDSTGLPDPDHYSTARDLALLTKAILIPSPKIALTTLKMVYLWRYQTTQSQSFIMAIPIC